MPRSWAQTRRYFRGSDLIFAGLVLLSAMALPGQAERAPAELCDAAALTAAGTQAIPLDVLRAITRVETGRAAGGRLQPWPWTVNMEGAGHWFPSRAAAEDYVKTQMRRGARSFDVGCFQINYKWHGHAFRDVDEMFSPTSNAAYAARFLADLHAELGNWSAAAGAYHSRTPGLARRYAARFDRIRSRLAALPAPPTTGTSFGPRRGIAFDRRLAAGPLIGGGAARNGSLVPIFGGSVAQPLFPAAPEQP